MRWQKADEDLDQTEQHIPVSRCASVIALHLAGDPISKISRRVRRRAKKEEGPVYDPFSPWRVLSITCYPDWKTSIDSHDSTKHYVNGPEAFLVTLRAEYKDARKRLEEVYSRVSDLVRMPVSRCTQSFFHFSARFRKILTGMTGSPSLCSGNTCETVCYLKMMNSRTHEDISGPTKHWES